MLALCGVGCLRHYQCQWRVQGQMLLKHRSQLSPEDATQSKPYSYETSRARPDCSESKCLITVVPTWHRHGKALGLRLQAISWASSHPSPPNHNQPSLTARTQAERGGWGWVSAAITDQRKLDFCPQTQLPLCPSRLRQQQSWPAGIGWEQVWKPSFSWIKQLLPASSQKKQQTGEKPIKCPSLDCSSLNKVRNSVLGSPPPSPSSKTGSNRHANMTAFSCHPTVKATSRC